MAENWEIRYWSRDWNQPIDFIGRSIMLPVFWIIGPIITPMVGISTGLISVPFILALFSELFFIVAGLMICPYQPVRIRWDNSQLMIKHQFLWSNLTIRLSDVEGWTSTPEKPFIVFRFRDKKRKENYNSPGWFKLSMRGMQPKDRDSLIGFLETNIKKEEWDIGLSS